MTRSDPRFRCSAWVAAVAAVLACTWPLAAGAISVNQELRKFAESFRARDFAAIEGEYRALRTTHALSDEGLPLEDEYVAFSVIDGCYQVDPGTAQGRQWTPERCDAYYATFMDDWQRAFPDSPLPKVGRAWAALAHVGWTRMLPVEREALLKSAWDVLQSVPSRGREGSWYQAAMTVATLDGWGPARFGRIYEEGAARYGGHTGFERTAARYYFPFNGGSVASLEAFARRAAARAGQQGAIVYAEIYEELVSFGGHDWQWAHAYSRLDWPLMREGLQARYRAHPVAVWRDRLAQQACLAGDLDTLAQALNLPATPSAPSGWFAGEEARCRKLAEHRQRMPAQPSRAVARLRDGVVTASAAAAPATSRSAPAASR